MCVCVCNLKMFLLKNVTVTFKRDNSYRVLKQCLSQETSHYILRFTGNESPERQSDLPEVAGLEGGEQDSNSPPE